MFLQVNVSTSKHFNFWTECSMFKQGLHVSTSMLVPTFYEGGRKLLKLKDVPTLYSVT